MGRGGYRGHKRDSADFPRDQQISRKLSWLLRHGVHQEGLSLGKGGYINVQEVLNTTTMRKLNITFRELREVVSNNDKKRFSMVLASSLEGVPPPAGIAFERENFEAEMLSNAASALDRPSDYLIRANQGHSIKVDNEGLLVPISVAAGNVPQIAVHGTNMQAWKLILQSGGLRRMTRNHIHFARGLHEASAQAAAVPKPTTETESAPVISGLRRNSSILIYVDVHKALATGLKFYLSENGVILSEGNEQGLLPCSFFARVEQRYPVDSILMRDGILANDTIVNSNALSKKVSATVEKPVKEHIDSSKQRSRQVVEENEQ